MNRTLSIRIRHHATKQWTHLTSHVTSAKLEDVQKQFEADYGQPVQVVEITESQQDAIRDQMYRSVVHPSFR